MNGSASNARLRHDRAHAAPKVAPVTRAIRSALAVSAAALALSAPVAGMAAGTCSHDTAHHAYACNGGFNQIIFSQTAADTNFVPPVDLTVVPGDQSPGIDAVWTGIAPVFSHAAIGIDASGAVEAWDVGRIDDVSLVHGGDALAGDIFATTINSLIAIDNGSDISVTGYGNVIALDIFDAYSANLDNSANISAEAGVGAGYFGTGAYATAVRINSMETDVMNDGGIDATASADGYYARARGVDAFGYSVGPTIHNAGDIQATAQADGGVARASGVYAFGYAAGSTVDNTGEILAIAHADDGMAYSSAINSIAYGYSGGRDASLTNSGTLSAEADADFAVALTTFNLARGRYANAYTSNASDGKIYAEATGNYTIAEAINNGAARYGNAVTSNAGGIHASAEGASGARAVGIVNYSTGSVATVDNHGSISATGMTTTAGRAVAIGIQNTSELYNANAYNAGSISVNADGNASAVAAGVLITAGKSSYVLNEAGGDIDVIASSPSGVAGAFGVYVSAPEVASLLNYGDISAQANGVDGDTYAYGALVLGDAAGIGLLINGGNISADASSAGGRAAFATGMYVTSDVATIFNDGSTAVTAISDGDGGMAVATGAKIYGMNSAIFSYGDLTVSASTNGYGSIASAAGAYSFGVVSSSVHNADDIHASASATGGDASAIGAGSIAYYFGSYASNTGDGTIVVEASGDHAAATGLLNASFRYGDAITTNEGSVSALADGVLSATAIGSYNFAQAYDSVVDNSGSISATAEAIGDIANPYALGAYAVGAQAINIMGNGYGAAAITNAANGSIVATASTQYGTANALGAASLRLSPYGHGETSVINEGLISAEASTGYGLAFAYGAIAVSLGDGFSTYGLATIDNGGVINSRASTDYGLAKAIGAYAINQGGAVIVDNRDDITASAVINRGPGYAYATGVSAGTNNAGTTAISNAGDIQAGAEAHGGFVAGSIGVQVTYTGHAVITNAEGANITSTADVDAFGFSNAGATAIDATAKYSNLVLNDGSVVADAHIRSDGGDLVFAQATGIRAYVVGTSYGSLTQVVNHGDVAATAMAEGADTFNFGAAGAVGVYAGSFKYDVDVQNTGSITASATSNLGIAAAYAVIVSNGSQGDAVVTNELGALIGAHAQAGSLASDVYGGRALSKGVQIFGSNTASAALYNDGAIVSHAIATPDGGGNAGPSLATAYGVDIGGGRGTFGSPMLSSSLDNGGRIEAMASADFGYAGAYGAWVRGGYDATVSNAGAISAVADADSGFAVAMGSYTWASIYRGGVLAGTAALDNSGTIAAGAYADGGVGLSYGAYVIAAVDGSLTNAGDISAVTEAGDLAFASGARALAGYSSSVYNAGAIHASANAQGTALAFGAYSAAEQLAYLTNANGGIIDVSATSQDGAAVAYGALANGAIGSDPYYGLGGGNSTTLLNYGDITASAGSVNGSAYAHAGRVYGGFVGIGLLINDGNLVADASAGADGNAIATGAYVLADVASVFNDDTIAASASAGPGGLALATGAQAGVAMGSGVGVYAAFAAINSYGDLTANAIADGGTAVAIGANSYGYFGSSFYNAGNIGANASADGGVASTTGASSVGIFTAYATNNGVISAEATGGQASAMGLYNASAFDAITANAGSISAVANGTLATYGEYEAVAFGIHNLALYYNSVIDNSGSISASASATTDIGGTDGFLVAKALGAVATSSYGYGETVIANAGSITASAQTSQGYAGAWGAVNLSGLYGTTVIENDGLISAHAHTDVGAADTVGAYARTIAGTAAVVNHGDIIASSRAERGIVDVSVNFSVAYGVNASSAPYGGGEVTVDNHGNIEANAEVLGGIAYAYGVSAYAANTSVNNAAGASITATVDAELFGGAFARAVNAGGMYGVDVVNDGSITAYGHANAHSEGDRGFYGSAHVFGIYADAHVMGDARVVNNGDVTAAAIAEHSVGFTQGGAGATGIYAVGKYDTTIVNTSNITAIAQAEFGPATANGLAVHGKYSSQIVNEAGSSIVASASSGSLYGDQQAGFAQSIGTDIFTAGMEYAVTYNAGSIVSRAVVTPDGTQTPIDSMAVAVGSRIGYNSGIEVATLDNRGSIVAAASADFGYANAYGAFVRSQFDSVLTNTGDIRASASATGGNAFAVGGYALSLHETISYNCDAYGCDYANPIIVVDGGESALDNSGDMLATVSADGGRGYGYGAVVLSAYAAGITNAGHISAVVEADDALAIGALANSFQGDATLLNSGAIGAKATGDIANASGVVVHGVYGVQVDNSGSIVAAAYGPAATATGASLESGGTHALANTGTLGAIARGDDALAVGMQADGFQTLLALQNTGAISASATGTTTADAYGVLLSGTGGLQFDNTGSIVATASGSNAFATAVSMQAYGSTALTNTGTIAAMGNGSRVAIASGASASLALANSGTIIGAITSGDLDDRFDNAAGATWLAVGTSDFGAGNDLVTNRGTIAMDDVEVRLGAGRNAFDNFGTIVVSGDSLVDMAQPFRNSGVIEFRDGAPDDVLTIVGDFAGEGTINLDVSALHKTSDHLYVGGVVNGLTTQTIDVDLGSLPGAPTVDIPLAFVGGNIEAGKFTLGNVRYVPYDFLTVDFSLKSKAGVAAAAQDVLSLAIEVTGVNDTGSTAAALAPGAQSLLNAQIGTWRQRMGVVPHNGGDVGVAPWVRYFTQSGDVDPSHGGNFGMGGDFGFHQSNSGWELGLDTRIGEQFAVGVLLAQSEGSQRLTDGAGSDRLDGDGYGVYGTWMANAFYVDASMRWLDIDARLRYPAGELKADASATAFNVEAGFTGWSLSGVNLVPQVQYTRTDVEDFSPLVAEQATFVHHGGTSSLGRLGMAFDKSFDASNWVLTPYGSLNAIREFDGEFDYTVNGGVHGNTSTEGTSAMVELGMGARTGGLSITGGANWTDGGAMQSVTGGQLVVRYDW